MKSARQAASVSNSDKPAEKLYIENTLLRVSGALFCHDPKRAAARTEPIALNIDLPEKRIVIRPDPEFGQPGQLAHKVFVALIKKHSDYGRPVQKQVSFTKREIMRMVGRREWGGRDSEELSRALHEIHHTFIKTHFKNAAGKYVEHSFNIFPEILIERREFASDPIEACTVTLADPIVASLEDEHFTCLNHALMRGLGTIGQALYMRLFFHFANLYDGRKISGLSFSKRYEDICAEWLGGLVVLQYRSKVLHEQLGRHLGQLVHARFLSSYAIAPAKSGKGFVVTFLPGRAFFEDYDRFYRKRGRRMQASGFETDRKGIALPLRVAYLFQQARTGKPAGSIGFVSSKDVETARQLLTYIGFDEMSAFLNYALAQAHGTKFDVQTLGGVKQYVSGYLAQRDHRRAAEIRQKARGAAEHEETLRGHYEDYRRKEAARILSKLPKSVRNAIEKEARAEVPNLSGPFRDRMLEVHKRMLTVQRYGNRIKSFERWKGSKRTV